MKIKFTIVKMLIAGFILLIGCSNPDENAEELLGQATKLISAASESESESYSKAYKLYFEALNKIETIINEYPSSYLAAAIPQEEVNIGKYSFTQLKEKVVPLTGLKAVGENDPLSCALFIFCQLQDLLDKEFIFLELSKLFAISGRYDDATKMATHINEPFYKIAAICEITNIVIDSGDNYKGLGLLAEGHNLALYSVKDNFEKVESLANIGCMYAKAKEYNKANKVFNEAIYTAKKIIIGRDKTIYALAKISSKLVEASWYDSKFYFGAMRLTKETDREPLVLFMCEESVIRKYIKSGKYDEAFNLIPSLEEKLNSIIVAENRDMCYSMLASIYAELYKFAKAKEYIYMIEDEFQKEKTLSKILGFYAGSGQFQEALEYVTKINDFAYKASALIQIVLRQPNYKQLADDQTELLHAIITDVSSEDAESCNMKVFEQFEVLKTDTKNRNQYSKIKDNANIQLQDIKQIAKTPEEAVKKVFRYAISGDVDSMKRYLIGTNYTLRSNPEKLRKLFIGYDNEKLIDVKPVILKKADYTAKVWVNFIYTDREVLSKPIELVYKDGGWKIICP